MTETIKCEKYSEHTPAWDGKRSFRCSRCGLVFIDEVQLAREERKARIKGTNDAADAMHKTLSDKRKELVNAAPKVTAS